MKEPILKLVYKCKRKLHFVSGFFIRIAGEMGILFFPALAIIIFFVSHNRIQYYLTELASFGIYAAFVTQQRGKMRDIIEFLDEKFQELSRLRIELCKKLLNLNAVESDPANDSFDEILDFFEKIGFFIRTGALSFILADESYAYWAIRYFEVCKERIKKLRIDNADPIIYESFEWFVSKIAIKGELNNDVLKAFINEEATLLYSPDTDSGKNLKR